MMKNYIIRRKIAEAHLRNNNTRQICKISKSEIVILLDTEDGFCTFITSSGKIARVHYNFWDYQVYWEIVSTF